jgi:hypothetical protein
MPLRPSPLPWKIEDYKGKGYQILAADGTLVALLHYPKGVDEAANCKLVQKAGELLEQFKGLRTLATSLLRVAGQDAAKNQIVQAAERLLQELEIRDPVKKPPAEMI